MLNVILLSAVAPNERRMALKYTFIYVIEILLNIAQDNLVVIPHSNEDILSVVMLSVTMLIVVLLSAVAPNKRRLA
jgi:hypothetical protein